MPGEALLARLGFRSPGRALAELPGEHSSDPRWSRLLEEIGRVADPDAALRRLLSLGAEVVERGLDSPERTRPLLAVLGYSDHLASVVRRLPGLAAEICGETPVERTELRDFKDAAYARIAARDLLSAPTKDSFVSTGRALAGLADECIARALGDVAGFAILAMGKYGGGELNYASDIDVLFVHRDDDPDEAQRTARSVMESMRGVFRVDADLRPEGRDGPLSRSLDSFAAYYKRWAQVWEFQSLIKCRFAAGDPGLGREFGELIRPFVWPQTLAAEAIEQVRDLKARAERALELRGRARREVKLGPGGIRDVEFAVQLLQLVHGRHHPELRVANTLDALTGLGTGGFVGEEDAENLAEAYVFLRHAEHRLQLVGGRQTHTLPAKEGDLEHLARGLGFRDGAERTALQAFEDEWRHTTALVRHLHERLFYRPLLEAFASVPAIGPSLDVREALERLEALGFDRPARAQQAIGVLTAGTSRAAKVMRAILPGALGWLSETPDPDAGLARLKDLAPALGSLPHLLATLRDEPPVAELLCRALGTGSVFAELLQREPGLVSGLEPGPAIAGRDAFVKEARAIVARARSGHEAVSALRRLKDQEWLRTAVRDLGEESFVESGRRLAHLGDACLEAALMLARGAEDRRTGGPPPGGFAIVGMGRFGGGEMGYASDLDVLYVYETDGDCPNGLEGRLYHSAVAERVGEMLGSVPPIFRVDAELRPEGRSGAIVRSLHGYAQYYERWAEPWEFLALIRARHAAGDERVTSRLLELAGSHLWPRELTGERIASLRHVKARIERERVKADPRRQVKLGVGGLADVEFTVQLLQTRHGCELETVRTPNTLDALEALREFGVIEERDAAWLRGAYLMLNRVRNHLFLLRGIATDALPARDEELERLARSLGYGRLSRSRFLEDYRRTTRRARRVCDRLFYGEP